MKVLITTVPFANKSKLPLELLEFAGAEYIINPLNKKLTEDELAGLVCDIDIIIAGTETISRKVMDNAPKLKLISRVGIGLDGVDLVAAKEKGILVSYTPDAPAPAVAELTMGLMLSLLRSIHIANKQLHDGNWNRIFGRRISEVTVGVIGAGRIGGRVIRRMEAFGSPRLMINDVSQKREIDKAYKVEWTTKEDIYKNADVITFHIPLSPQTKNLVKKEHLLMMKPDALIINTSRGGIINENDLADVLESGHLGGVAIDVFEQEPYSGRLANIDNCLLTAHMGSMSIDCRSRMELEATQEAIRFINGSELELLVPEVEYTMQSIN
ncbi:phosphoglycerate dehydrogenase [Vibrio genomosp. F10]|uniref:phosphoglycerate dehydrogenase n=1 Tax=Vibrio genomosp. F10 TaxID=723171 RepID=UPI0002E78A85|nr:phosphoglycerate dehydrogenase [Vibrio genomosp. F10]OEF04573.1 lactate dehydrogenase [Vibrio genomosp. F10 str. 9ZB36]